jgi:hypothetical protein
MYFSRYPLQASEHLSNYALLFFQLFSATDRGFDLKSFHLIFAALLILGCTLMAARQFPHRLLCPKNAFSPTRTYRPKLLPWQSHPSRIRPFSTSPSRKLMEMSGFTEEQLAVRNAISKICANFPNEYWREHDQSETDPHELHAALAKDGWLGIALPEELGGAGLGAQRGWPSHTTTMFSSDH